MAFTLNRRLAQLVDSNGQLNTGKIPNDYITSDHVADNTITAAMLHTSFTVAASNLTSIDTDDVSEGTSNLYFTNARARGAVSATGSLSYNSSTGVFSFTQGDTDTVSEGSTNLYFTNARADARIALQVGANLDLSSKDTDDLSEGSTNLYFTNARIDSHLSGGTGVTYSSGAISIGQDVSTTATPTFGNITLGTINSGNITTTGYIAGPATFTIDPAAVGDNTGTVVIAGNLQVDGTTTTVNSTTVEVSDKTIELGYDATTDAANNGAGIVVSRPETSDASFLWSETNERFETNKEFSVMEQFTINANGTNDNHIEIGGGTSDNHYAYVDLIGDSTYSDYGLRIIRNNSGANTSSVIHHRGTGALVLETLEAGIIKLRTSNTDALTVDTSQNTTFAGDAIIGSGGGLKLLPTDASDTDPWILYQYTDNTLRYNFTGSGADEIIIKYPNATNATTLLVDTEQKRVGIGTTSPQRNLTVTGSADTPSDNTGILSITDGTGVNTDAKMQFGITSNGHGYIHTVKPGTDIKSLLLAPAGGSGRVGIGMSSTPSTRLHVAGETYLDNNSTLSSASNRQLTLRDSDNTSMQMYFSIDDSVNDGIGAIQVTESGVTNDRPLLLQYHGGNVGIGTDSPRHKLSVNGTLGSSTFSGFGLGVVGGIATAESDDTNRAVGIQATSSTNSKLFSYDYTNSAGIPLSIQPDNANVYICSGGGDVGIGTSSPSAKLHIQPANSDTLENAIFTRQNNAAGTDGNTFVLRNDAANNFVEMNSGGTNNGGYKFYIGTFSSTPAMTIIGAGSNSGNVGIGVTNPGYKLAVSSKLAVGDSPAVGLSGNTIHVRENSSSGIHFPLVIGGGTHVAGAAFGLAFDPEGYGNRNKIAILAEGIGAGYSRGRLHFALDSVSDSGQVTLAESKMCILENGNVGIGAQLDNAGHKLHVWGGSAHTNLAVTTNDGYKSEVRMMEDKAGTTHGGFIRYDGNGDYVQIGHYNNGTEMMGWSMDDAGNIALGATNASGHFEVHGGRMGIVSTDSSWEQLRVCNTSTTGEAGIAIFNGANSGEFLSDTQPIFSNAFTLAINPYGCGSDTLAIGHGNLTDSIWHIDGSGNFGYGPNTENPVSYYEISKTRPNVNAPSDYELKLTLNTYGYVGSNYKLGMLQFLGGDTAGAQDNFYAALSARAANGANNQEDGALQFHVKTAGYSDTLAAEFNGDNNPSSQIAGSGSVRNGMLFRWQGIAIDRSWGNYPGIAVMNSSDYSTNSATQAEFRVHGTNGSSSSYPSTSGSDFSVNFRVDGSYISGSDRRRKTNITTIDNALEKVNQLTGKRFQTVNRAGEVNENQSKADNYKFGLIAQEVEDIIPEATKYYEDEDDGTEGWNSSYSIDYPSLTALLINAIKEQDVVIQDLKSRIETLEG